ncbi:hypothetical protein L3Q82_008478, partial [Scortum barcoo]
MQSEGSLQGEVKLMRSDNGTNLVRAEGELRDALKELDVHIKDTLLKEGITWAFNPPQVPTMVAYGRDKSSQSEESSVLFCASKHWMKKVYRLCYTQGLGTSLKILFSERQIEALSTSSVQRPSFQLSRQEIVSLLNAFG